MERCRKFARSVSIVESQIGPGEPVDEENCQIRIVVAVEVSDFDVENYVIRIGPVVGNGDEIARSEGAIAFAAMKEDVLKGDCGIYLAVVIKVSQSEWRCRS